MSADWQISIGLLSEPARPALFALAVLASAWVLFDSRRLLAPLASALWTLSALVLPHVFLPLYLIARAYARPTAAAAQDTSPAETVGAHASGADDAPRESATTPVGATCDAADAGPARDAEAFAAHDATAAAEVGVTPDAVAATGVTATSDTSITPGAAVTPGADVARGRPKLQFARRLALASAYAAAVLSCGALYYYADYRSADAHLARARQARIDGRQERALAEYRAALRREDDPHVRKLLGLELSKAGRWDEALAELRAAERGGEPDDALSFHVATALAALDRADEAGAHYRKFLQSRLCAQAPPDWRCEGVRASIAP